MRLLKNKLYPLLLSMLVLLLAGCSNDIESMLDGYNSHFVKGSERAPLPGDPDFDARDLLKEEYLIYDDATLIISAPSNAKTISWVFTDPDNNYEVVTVCLRAGKNPLGRTTYFCGTEYTGEQLYLYVPESMLESPKTYKLTLTITDEEETTYTDSCGIVIYKHYIR